MMAFASVIQTLAADDPGMNPRATRTKSLRD